MWFNKVNYQISVNEDVKGKTFPFGYPHIYSSSYNGEIYVKNNGEVKAPLNIIIAGAVNNPRVDILDGDTIISSLKIMVKSDDCIITVNSDESDQFITITENGVAKNAYQMQDFSCDNFFIH